MLKMLKKFIPKNRVGASALFLAVAMLLALLSSSLLVNAQTFTGTNTPYTDPSPPSGWVQCAGFVNTAGNDIESSFMDGCLNADGLRLRSWSPSGVLEDDVYVTGISPKRSSWPNFAYVSGPTPQLPKKMFWTGTALFLTTTDGRDACAHQAAPSGLVFGSGNSASAVIAAGNTGYNELRMNCGGGNIPDRKIAIYKSGTAATTTTGTPLALTTSSFTHGGVCDASCGSSQLCVGVAPGLTCQTSTGSFGVCDSSCKCVVKGLDDNKAACLLKGYKWSSAGETTPFGGFSQADIDSGKEECVGDDAGEYYRFRECETALCKTDASDYVACKSKYSCVFDKKCFARTDKSVEEVEGLKSEASKSAGQTDEKSSMLQKLLVLNQQQKTAKAKAEKKAIGRDIASLLSKIERQGGLLGLTVQPLQKIMKAIPRKTATGVLTGNTDNVLCTPSMAMTKVE